DVSAYVARGARGGGVGKRLYVSLLRVLTAQGFYRAYAGIALPNDASVALHRSAGFALVGTYRRVGFKCGSWRDVSWWECELAATDEPPTEPLSLDDIDVAPLLRG
ncbi:MAG: GNAT family N-acetyltransferase, partial [Candidatus Eremiobacteraeota bacterium]|nr:GNAT family N-acetyltransferase [Candidatus Eremiobacteraeota bacterium]